MIKQDLREQLLARRRAITPEQRALHDAALSAHVLAWWERQPVGSMGVYWPIRGEPDLQSAHAELARRGVQLALPVVIDANSPLQFVRWTPGDAMVAGAMKVPIPATPHIIAQPAALLIPCVGFNPHRMRLGYGGGFYDRTLAQEPRPLAIGIAYRCLETNFPADGHDIALDTILTEEGAS
ncbi:MAG TPA: 5-formyltetrahydrofolate cyclo-ligase [Burkholderiaceae bacterium]|nr:5-formyltetrahydrofolate cyclo-ligase [Burkholderiaceae bacterium]